LHASCLLISYCSALLECYVGSREKKAGASENGISVLRYVQKHAAQYYKQVFSLIVSSTVRCFGILLP